MDAEWGGGQARKRLLKLARRVSDQEIVEFLTRDGSSLSSYYLRRSHGFTLIRVSDPHHGEMEMTIDGDVMAIAVTLFLEQRGAVLPEGS